MLFIIYPIYSFENPPEKKYFCAGGKKAGAAGEAGQMPQAGSAGVLLKVCLGRRKCSTAEEGVLFPILSGAAGAPRRFFKKRARREGRFSSCCERK
jgi:hypothetical protein